MTPVPSVVRGKSAAYFAFIKPGDTIMAMNLSHGGHLTHGSPVNFSGQLYNVVQSAGKGTLGGCNFSVLFPVWDLLGRTADFRRDNGPCGIRDQLPEEGGRDYGEGFWAQQWMGLQRLVGRA